MGEFGNLALIRIRYEARIRWTRCVDISKKARLMGLDASPEMVNYRFDEWRRWDEGRMPTGHIIKVTGVQPTSKRGK